MTQKYCAICGRMIFETPHRLYVAEVNSNDKIQEIPGMTSLVANKWLCHDCYSRITMKILTTMIERKTPADTKPLTEPEALDYPEPKAKRNKREKMPEKPKPVPEKATHKPNIGTVIALYKAGWSRERIAEDIGLPISEVTEMCAQAHAEGKI